jgi:hypothetical protein
VAGKHKQVSMDQPWLVAARHVGVNLGDATSG